MHEQHQQDQPEPIVAYGPGQREITLDANSDQARALERAIEQSLPADAPRIWAGSIPDCLVGTPHGRWIEAAQSTRRVADDVIAMLAGAPSSGRGDAPYWGIFAAQGFGRFQPDRAAGISDIVRRAHAARNEAEAYAAWIRLGDKTAAHYEQFGTAYQGHFDSLRDYVTLQVEAAGYDQLLDERVPAHLRPFVDIDIDALAHDMAASGEISVIHDRHGRVWIFTNLPKRQSEQSLG